MYRGGSSAIPVYLGLGANITYTNWVTFKFKTNITILINLTLKFSALHLTKCIKWSNLEAAGLVEYTKWASSTLTNKVVGISRLPNTTLPYVLDYNNKQNYLLNIFKIKVYNKNWCI